MGKENAGMQSPQLPQQLLPVSDPQPLLETDWEEEGSLTCRRFHGLIITGESLSALDIKESVFERCRFLGCAMAKAEFIDVRFDGTE